MELHFTTAREFAESASARLGHKATGDKAVVLVCSRRREAEKRGASAVDLPPAEQELEAARHQRGRASRLPPLPARRNPPQGAVEQKRAAGPRGAWPGRGGAK